MNFQLAKEIYGTAWYMDALSMQRYSMLLNHIKSGAVITGGVKANSTYIYDAKNKVELVEKEYKLDNLSTENQNISVIKLDGAITKSGGESSYGTAELAAKLRKFDASNKILGHILLIDSGGGSANAVAEMADAIREAKKPVVCFVDGMMASAALYIGSYADYIFAKRGTDMIGSIGTMIELQSFKNIDEDKSTGERVVRIYADKSVNKNKAFEEAINNLNFVPIKEQVLNPHNERFIADMKANRVNIKELELTGEIFDASQVVGSLIDEIGSFEKAVNKVLELSKIKNFTNQKSIIMNKSELLQQHTALYNEVMSEGAENEKQRVGAWLAFEQVDLTAVKAGIESGANVNQKVIAEMAAKAMANATLKTIENESAKDLNTGSEQSIKNAEQIAVEEFEKQVYASINLKKQ